MKHPYTPEDLDACAIADLLSDAKRSEEQAVSGPYYPDRGITKETLLAYAAKCMATATKFQAGGAHRAVVNGLG